MPAKKKHAKHPRKKTASKHTAHKPKMSLEEERTLFVKEQTVLAKERTILSFMRTGLGFITAGFAIIAATAILEGAFKIHPMTSFVIGTGLVIVGFLETFESFRRLRVYKQKMEKIKDELGDEDV